MGSVQFIQSYIFKIIEIWHGAFSGFVLYGIIILIHGSEREKI